jgi:hypothetical protein
MNYSTNATIISKTKDFEYAFKKGAHVKSLTPEVVGREMDTIYNEYGKIDATTVVNLARKKNHPLHAGFEWDNSIAGEEYRKHQARVMIGAVIKIKRTDPEPIRYRRASEYINVTRKDDRTYVSTAKALSDEELRKQVLKRALKEAKSWKERYINLKELSKIFSAIDSTTV